MVADGPFAESKEAIGGYFLLKVDSLDEAVAIAQECPGLPYGAKVEVRPVMAQCPLSGEAVPKRNSRKRQHNRLDAFGQKIGRAALPRRPPSNQTNRRQIYEYDKK